MLTLSSYQELLSLDLGKLEIDQDQIVRFGDFNEGDNIRFNKHGQLDIRICLLWDEELELSINIKTE